MIHDVVIVERVLPGFHAFQTLRHELLEQERARLHLAQFQAQPLTTFVRNRLIDEVYLPLIGANLARQIGAAGEASRSDRSGLLLLISPPGYGKTTKKCIISIREQIFLFLNYSDRKSVV